MTAPPPPGAPEIDQELESLIQSVVSATVNTLEFTEWGEAAIPERLRLEAASTAAIDEVSAYVQRREAEARAEAVAEKQRELAETSGQLFDAVAGAAKTCILVGLEVQHLRAFVDEYTSREDYDAIEAGILAALSPEVPAAPDSEGGHDAE